MKKKVAMFVCFVLLSSCLAPGVFALDEQHAIVQEEVTTRYEIISVITASLNISTSGRADCSASVRVPSGYKVELTAELQQKDGSKWETIHDWEASGSNRISVSGPWYVMPDTHIDLRLLPLLMIRMTTSLKLLLNTRMLKNIKKY